MPEVVLSAGERVGAYVIEKELGRGAHGVVYLARHRERMNVPLALKVVDNRGNLDRLLVEPEILSRLRHPGIVGLSDYFLEQDRVVVALEFIAGEDLQAYLTRRGPLPPAEVREFLRQMAAALDHAHAAGVLHRDIKPANILVESRPGEKPRFVLTDFGISRMSEGIQLTRHGGGTYLFMAPEQLRGRPEKASDLWALGVVAYLLLTGELPFRGDSVDELSKQVFFMIPPPPHRVRGDIQDEALERVVADLLEKQVTARTASAAALLDQLGEQRREADEPAARAAAATSSPTVPRTTYETRLRTRIRRHWNWFGVTAVLMMGPYGFLPQLLLLFGAFLFWRGQRTTTWRIGWPWTLGGFACMSVGSVASLFFSTAAQAATDEVPLVGGLFVLVAVVCGLVLPFVVVYHFSAARRLQRELTLRLAITSSSHAPRAYSELLRDFLDERPEDVRLHQRYVESLLAQGDSREAAVEALLLLENDPYHFGASLLLAQAYFELGLLNHCVLACENYLRVAGYCFEFEELRTRCRAATAV